VNSKLQALEIEGLETLLDASTFSGFNPNKPSLPQLASRFDELYLFHDPCMVYFPVLALASPIQQKGLNVSDQGQRQEMEAS